MEIKMKKIVVFLLFLLVFVTLSAWDEFNQYSIADELKKPGVKLVAVDFYATWCEPCNAAIPKWKKLQEKYGDKGFKLIVVSVQSEGSCSQPPQWNPDKIVCDYDGDIADAWHANDLPQAFLWSWQGNLLVAHGGVDNVAAAIEKYFKKIPRVLVEEGSDKNIYKMVRSELIKNSKIEVVASDAERKALADLRKKSASLNYDTKLQCKLGEEISANSRLVISKQKRGKKDALILELFSVERGCLTASGTATMHGNIETEVAEAVYNLLKNLLGDVKMPGKGEKQVKTEKQVKNTVQNSADQRACEYAAKENTIETWEDYLASFPSGECSFEAKSRIKKLKKELEKEFKEKAQKIADAYNQRKQQLEEQERKAAYLKGRKIGNLIWSDRSTNTMNWNSAKQYCKKLKEGGYNDWRLPNIDELRTLIQNHPGTQTGGSCPISERAGKLAWSAATGDCDGRSGSNFSKLGDIGWFWSSSTWSGYMIGAWGVNFTHGNVVNILKSNLNYVRCVR